MKQLLLYVALVASSAMFAQRTCGTDIKRQELFAQNPQIEANYNQLKQAQFAALQNVASSSSQMAQPAAVVTVPVVFHVLYKNADENVSDAQIQSQLDVLNADYRKLNTDFTTVVPAVFQPFGADLEIVFVKASVDPDGNATTGITRKAISNSFNFYSNYYTSGGTPAWDPEEYLNVWIGDLNPQGLLGFAYGPEASGQLFDGLCIGYYCFGDEGSAEAPYNKGRTATHEIGHYFGLEHPWGTDEDACGVSSDGASDTPPTSGPYYGCPNFPTNEFACTNTTNGSMFMNYMDYVDDACMAFFTANQKTIVTFVRNTSRSSVLLGNAQFSVTSKILIYPNPVGESFRIDSPNVLVDQVEIYTVNGQLVKSQKLTSHDSQVNASDMAPGTYLLRMYGNGQFLKSDKIIKN